MKRKYEFINWLGREYGFQSYLEISTLTTGNFYHRIDPEIYLERDCLNYRIKELDKMYPKKRQEHKIKRMTYQYHLNRLIQAQTKFDVILVDPYHTYEQTQQDLNTAIKFLNPGGFIIVHDCDPPDQKYTGKLKPGNWCGDTYQAFIDYRIKNPGVESFMIDMDYGCGIICPDRKSTNHQAIQTINPDQMTVKEMGGWKYFREHRETLLNLMTANQALRHCRKVGPRVCILVIASDDRKIYRKFREIWELYMDLYEEIDCYFLSSDETLTEPYQIEEHDIKIQTKECLVPGILRKTVGALKALEQEQLLSTYDYVIRTNLSSFWVFDRLSQYLRTQPRENYVSARMFRVNCKVFLPKEISEGEDELWKKAPDEFLKKFRKYLEWEKKEKLSSNKLLRRKKVTKEKSKKKNKEEKKENKEEKKEEEKGNKEEKKEEEKEENKEENKEEEKEKKSKDLIKFPSGSGYIMSVDIVRKILEGEEDLEDEDYPDDVALGRFFVKEEIEVTPAKIKQYINQRKMNFKDLKIPGEIYHFRVKNLGDRSLDVKILEKLVKEFY